MGTQNSFHLSGHQFFKSLTLANIKLNYMKTPSLKLKNAQILTILCVSVPYDVSKPPSNEQRETSLKYL